MDKIAHGKKIDNLLIKGAMLIDPASKLEKRADLQIEKGKIIRIGRIGAQEGFELLDGRELVVTPGWMDMHVHFRQPGREDEETVESGASAAVAGGFTAACPMPNTSPAADSREVVEFLIEEGRKTLIDVYPIAAATKGRQGKELSEMAELVEAGAVAFSDDGCAIATAALARRAMEYASMFEVPIIEHAEEPTLVPPGGSMNEGKYSTRLGLGGMPTVAEDVIVARDILLAEYTGAHLHVAHISSAASIELVRRAKARGLKVSCEVTPHHFTLTDAAVVDYDANTKMNPPLRSQRDVDAVHEGLQDGTIDAIATDHAPHAPEEKDVEYQAAPFGIIGLETALGLIVSKLVKTGVLSLAEAIAKVVVQPRRILRLPPVALEEGQMANLTMFSPERRWTVTEQSIYSKCRNTPFKGWELTGSVYGVYNKRRLWLNPDF